MPSKFPHRPEELAAYRGSGYELIPLHVPNALDQRGRPIGKAPIGKAWRLAPHLSVEDARAHMASEGNVGVRLRPEDLVVDVDPRNFEDGDDPLARLQEDLGVDLTGYPTVVTGSGGKHIYMTKPAESLLRDTLEAYQGIEFKSLGRQVVAAGSVHPSGGTYLWDDDVLAVPLAMVKPAPTALLEIAKRPGRLTAVDAGSRTPEELELMLEGLDPSHYGDHERWFELMCACHHATGGEGREEWIAWSTSDPKYGSHGWQIGRRWDSLHADQSGRRVTEKTLFKALVDARRADLLPPTSAEDDFKDELIEVQGSEDDLSHLESGDPTFGPLEEMNAKGYCAVNENGVFRIYRQKRDYTMVSKENPEGRMYWETYKKGDFLDIHSNRLIPTADNKVVPVASEWLKWGGRTSFDGVAFDPAGRIPKKAKILNLWSDWAVEPKRGDWSMLQRLLLEGLCDGDQEAYEYCLDWAAHMVQRPDEQAEVALVFKGQKGTGKGTFGRALYKLAGRHGLHISSQHHFTNHFNAHLRDCILLFADEAMWAGDKKAEGELKRLITEPTILLEAKGKDAVTCRNMLHVLMASNEDWVVPASMEDERRFAIFEVGTKFRGNRAFFDQVHGQLQAGGLNALLFDLKRRQLGDFHPRARIPQTSALAKQKVQSLDNIDAWWYECLCRGHFGDDAVEAIGCWDSADPTDTVVYFTDDLKSSLEDYLRKLGDRHLARRSTETMIGDRLRRRLGEGVFRHVRLKVPEDRFNVKADSSGRAYGYKIPCLSECRAMFEAQLGSKLEWKLDAEEIRDPLLDVEEL